MPEQPTTSDSKKTRYSRGVYVFGFVFLSIALSEWVTGYAPPSHGHLRRVNSGEVKIDIMIAAGLLIVGVVVGIFESEIARKNRGSRDG